MDKQYSQAGSTTITAGGTAQDVTLGFAPTYVKVINVNNATIYEWFAGMDNGTSIDTVTSVAANTAGSITITENGFTMGTDIADTTSDVIHWLALR